MKKAKLAILLVAFLWGSSFAFQKEVLTIIDPVTFTFYNFLLTGIIFLLYSIYTKKNLFYRLKEGVILGLLITGMELTQMWGLHVSTASNTAFISNLGMLFIPYLGFLMYRHKITLVDSCALFAAGGGMYFLVGGVHGVSFGDFLLLISAFFMAFYFLMSQVYEGETRRHLSVLCTQQFITVSAVVGVFMLFGRYSFVLGEGGKLYFFFLIIVFTVLPYALIQWSSRYSDEMMMSMYDGVLEPLIGGVVAWVIFSEKTSVAQVFGGLLMVFAFGASSIYRSRSMFFKKSKKVSC